MGLAQGQAVRKFDALTGINSYVKAMTSSADLTYGPQAFSLGTPALGVDTSIEAAGAANAVAGTIRLIPVTAAEPYGRTITFGVSADPGAAGTTVDVYGFDYLGQPMIERFTIANGSTTAIVGKKAFKSLTKAVVVTASTNAVTNKIGWGLRLGVPYRGVPLWLRENGVLVAVTLGTNFILPILTDPQTATTGDPRGTIVPAATFDAIKEFVVGLQGDAEVNASGNGGLHGIKHYFA